MIIIVKIHIYPLANFLGGIVGTFMIWSGSSFIAYSIESRLDWEKDTLKKSLLLIFCNIIYIIFCLFFVISIITIILGNKIPFRVYTNSFIYSFLATLIVNLIFIIIGIHDYWKKAKAEIGILKQENLRSQLETLKNQVNPHFLFNSLNTLISIIDEEPEIAKNFTQKLAQVYRYILQAKEKDVVPLSEELQFSEAYEYMLTIRYGDNLKFTLNPQTILEILFFKKKYSFFLKKLKYLKFILPKITFYRIHILFFSLFFCIK